MRVRSITFGIFALCAGWWLFSPLAIAAPEISAQCDSCLIDNGVLSVAVGVPVQFQVSDAERPIREVIWLFGDGQKGYGIGASHAYLAPGRYTAEALVIYTDAIPVSQTVTVHVLAAPIVNQRMIWGLPTEIVYPILSALAVVIVYWLTGTMP